MSLRIVIDMNLSPQWLPTFKKHGIEAVHWSDIGRPNAPDEEISNWARKHRYIIFTHDLDFGTMLALTQEQAPSIIQVRSQNILPESMADIVVKVIHRYEKELLAGALLVVDETRSRVRILPLT